jgi:hypothetical protein
MKIDVVENHSTKKRNRQSREKLLRKSFPNPVIIFFAKI